MSGESTHMARPSNETSMVGPTPVLSRWTRPAAMPPAMDMPPARSPKAALPPIGYSEHSGVRALATPPRAQ